jgi:hypothetical protein
MLLKRALNRLLRVLPPGEMLDGFNSAEVIETIFRKSLAYHPNKPLAEAAGKSTLLDFGGGCGVHYRQALLINPDARWAIVEHPAVVRRTADNGFSKRMSSTITKRMMTSEHGGLT